MTVKEKEDGDNQTSNSNIEVVLTNPFHASMEWGGLEKGKQKWKLD